jgi:DNA-binding CsgD family transcriptional regulator
MDPREWPFVGRDDLLTELDASAARSGVGGVVISGPAGIGKTRLADEFARRHAGERIARLTGSPATVDIPYSALAHLVLNDAANGEATPVSILAAIRATLGDGRRTLLLADDVGWIDEASWSIVGHLLALGEVFVVGTNRIGTALPITLDALARQHGFTWITADALGDDDVIAAAEGYLGVPLDPRAAGRLAGLCAGNPLYLRELLLQGVDSGGVRIWPSGTAWFEPDVGHASRLVELVGDRLRGLGDAERSLMQLVTVVDDLSVDDLDRIGALDTAVTLERHGLLRVDVVAGAQLLRPAHPLHAEVIRATTGPIEARGQFRRAIDLVRSRPVARADDELRIAMWQLDAGIDGVDPAALVAGAKAASAAFDVASTVRLARAVERVAPSTESQQLLMNALFLLGDWDGCLDVAARPLPAIVDPTTLVVHTSLQLYSILWGKCDPARAMAFLDTRRPVFAALGAPMIVDYFEGFVHAHDGEPVKAAAVLGDTPPVPVLQFLSAVQRAMGWVWQGHHARAVAEIDLARAFLDGGSAGTDMNSGWFALVQGLARCALGSFDEALETVTVAHAEVRDQRVALLRSFLSICAAEVLLSKGRLEDAASWYRHSIDTARPVGVRSPIRIARSGLATIAGLRNDVDAARQQLADLDAAGDDVRLMLADTVIGRAWATAALGERAEARRIARDGFGDLVARGEMWGALRVLVESSRLGDPRWAAERLDDLDPIEGPWAAALAAYVRAFAGRLAAPHRVVAATLEGLGADLLAAEAYAAAAEAERRDGNPKVASRDAAHSARLAAGCQGAATSLLDATDPVVLTRREREIAELAAIGWSNADIATKLVVSRRTVENQLQRVYTKLGVSTRDALRDHL